MILIASASPVVLAHFHSFIRLTGPSLTAFEYGSVTASLAMVKPKVLLLDLALTELDPSNAIADLHQLMPSMKIVALLPEPSLEIEMQALCSGARGCCTYDVDLVGFERMMTTIEKGEMWYRRALTPLLLDAILESVCAQPDIQKQEPTRFSALTDREYEIAVLVARGYSNKAVARYLTITERTVKFHLTGIFRKLGVSSRLGIVTELKEELGSQLFSDIGPSHSRASERESVMSAVSPYLDNETPYRSQLLTFAPGRTNTQSSRATAFDALFREENGKIAAFRH